MAHGAQTHCIQRFISAYCEGKYFAFSWAPLKITALAVIGTLRPSTNLISRELTPFYGISYRSAVSAPFLVKSSSVNFPFHNRPLRETSSSTAFRADHKVRFRAESGSSQRQAVLPKSAHERTFVKAVRNSSPAIYAAAANPRGLSTYSLRIVSAASTSTRDTS